ncbi:LysR family transcriptional regulator [Pontivivens ytuae]|uniref:LysR family transcriptional regulator n=1 Tax=Pontivivens ytuae TaxID=2789856 RepID=A0A7S9LVJ1_9RHOB|nr:LysR family transcriptional regulator [Pontivivens ytuae]QPH56049.1 LysR family transcriptional regulator [Pontivivens ytuae]
MAKTLDRFDLMRLYVRIAETGSLSAAGRSLGLSQPSASRQLRELETELGTQLIMRTTHELSFTDAGQEFLSDARQLLGEWEAVAERFRLQKDDVRGKIRVAAPSGLGQTIMADIAGSFVERFPGVSIEWQLNDAPRDLIGEGIDLWIRVGPITDESLIVRGLWQIERAVIAAPSSGITAAHPGELADAPAVVLGPYVGTEIELTGPDGKAVTLVPKVTICTNNIFAAERLTLGGRGYSILPLWLMQPAIDANQARIVCQGWLPPPLKLSVAYPQTRYRPARLSLFIEHLKQELPATGAGIVMIKG